MVEDEEEEEEVVDDEEEDEDRVPFEFDNRLSLSEAEDADELGEFDFERLS